MDDVDFEPFVRMTAVNRLNLLKVLARLLVTQYCFNMFKVGVREEVLDQTQHQFLMPGENKCR